MDKADEDVVEIGALRDVRADFNSESELRPGRVYGRPANGLAGAFGAKSFHTGIR